MEVLLLMILNIKDEILTFNHYNLYLYMQFYIDVIKLVSRRFFIFVEIMPPNNNNNNNVSLISKNRGKIQKITIRLRDNEIYDLPKFWLTRSSIYDIPNNQYLKPIDMGKTHFFIFESTSVKRLHDFDEKPCIQTNIGLFDEDLYNQCYMDCLNNLYNQTFGCLPIMNERTSWIRLERDLKYFRYKICKEVSRDEITNLNLNWEKFHPKCLDQCPSPCTIPLFKVNSYVKDNPTFETILNIIPKYNIEISFIESYRMSFNDLFYEFGGIIGLWLGLSVNSLTDLIIYSKSILRIIILYYNKDLLKYFRNISAKILQIIFLSSYNFSIKLTRSFQRKKPPKLLINTIQISKNEKEQNILIEPPIRLLMRKVNDIILPNDQEHVESAIVSRQTSLGILPELNSKPSSQLNLKIAEQTELEPEV